MESVVGASGFVGPVVPGRIKSAFRGVLVLRFVLNFLIALTLASAARAEEVRQSILLISPWLMVDCPNSPSFQIEVVGREPCGVLEWKPQIRNEYGPGVATTTLVWPYCRSTGARPATTGADIEWVVRQGSVEVGRFWLHGEAR